MVNKGLVMLWLLMTLAACTGNPQLAQFESQRVTILLDLSFGVLSHHGTIFTSIITSLVKSIDDNTKFRLYFFTKSLTRFTPNDISKRDLQQVAENAVQQVAGIPKSDKSASCIYDALVDIASSEASSSTSSTKQVVILISDGADNMLTPSGQLSRCSSHSWEQAIGSLKSAPITLYAIEMQTRETATTSLDIITQQSGGQVLAHIPIGTTAAQLPPIANIAPFQSVPPPTSGQADPRLLVGLVAISAIGIGACLTVVIMGGKHKSYMFVDPKTLASPIEPQSPEHKADPPGTNLSSLPTLDNLATEYTEATIFAIFHIIKYPGNLQGNQIAVYSTPFTIGRPKKDYWPDLQLADDLQVSHRHVEIHYVNGVCFLQDCGSTNGTRLNHDITPLEPYTKIALKPEDQIHLTARTVLMFVGVNVEDQTMNMTHQVIA